MGAGASAYDHTMVCPSDHFADHFHAREGEHKGRAQDARREERGGGEARGGGRECVGEDGRGGSLPHPRPTLWMITEVNRTMVTVAVWFDNHTMVTVVPRPAL